jgi:hypothetical protein
VDALVSRLGVGELVAAAAIAAFVDELLRGVEIVARRDPRVGGRPAGHEAEQPRAMEMNVGEEEPHRPALGDLIRVVEVVARAVESTGDSAEKRG